MEKLDKMIELALAEEDRDILAETGELGLPAQGMALFRGPNAWWRMLTAFFQTVIFIVAVWAAWRFFIADDVLGALKFGLPAAVGMIMSAQMKSMLFSDMEANRIIREIKRLELMVARRS